MSCHGLADDRAKSAAAGFAAHLAKPFTPEALRAVPPRAGDDANRNRAAASDDHDAASPVSDV